MWCSHCQADVAGEMSPGSNRVLCTSCSTELSSSATAGKLDGKARNARQLLERWSRNDLPDPFAGPHVSPVAQPSSRRPVVTLPIVEADELPVTPSRDDSDSEVAPVQSAPIEEPGDAKNVAPSRESIHESPVQDTTERRATIPLRSMPTDDKRTPTGAFTFEPDEVEPRKTFRLPAIPMITGLRVKQVSANAQVTFGQLMAYLGVAGLTIGGTLGVWGYFGGPAGYLSTGCLVALIGQMFLFLGIATLIAGSLEQSNCEMVVRSEKLLSRIDDLEKAVLATHESQSSGENRTRPGMAGASEPASRRKASPSR